MGSWGTESCSNDPCHDALSRFCSDIHEMSQAEADKTLGYVFTSAFKKDYGECCFQSRLGVIIWILSHGLHIKKSYLIRGLGYAKTMLADKAYLNRWVDDAERKTALQKEIKDIQYAMKNDGRAPARKIEGLMSKITSLLGKVT